jgi:hypothetical protein
VIKASNKSDSALTSQGIQITEQEIFLQEHGHSIFTQVRLHVSKRSRLHQHEKIWPHAHTRPNRRAGYTVRELTAARLHGSRRATLTRFSRLKYLRSLKPATRRQRVVRQAGSACRWIRFLGTLCICRLPAQLPGTLEGTRPFTQPATCPSYTTRPKFSALSLLVHILQSWSTKFSIRTCRLASAGHDHDLLNLVCCHASSKLLHCRVVSNVMIERYALMVHLKCVTVCRHTLCTFCTL